MFGIMTVVFPAEISFINVLKPEPEPKHEPELASPNTPRPESIDSRQHLLTGDSSPVQELWVDDATIFQTIPGKIIAPTARDFYKIKKLALYWTGNAPWYARRRSATDDVILQEEDRRRWRLAYSAMKRCGLTTQTVINDLLNDGAQYISYHSTLQSSANFKEPSLFAVGRSLLAAVALTSTYGLPHLLGWNTVFPTEIERTIWRVSTLFVTLWGLWISLGAGILITIGLLAGSNLRERRGETRLLAGATALYITASSFLVLESLRQLFFLDPQCYVLQTWSTYFPHFS